MKPMRYCIECDSWTDSYGADSAHEFCRSITLKAGDAPQRVGGGRCSLPPDPMDADAGQVPVEQIHAAHERLTAGDDGTREEDL
jgi:hypothetical protein